MQQLLERWGLGAIATPAMLPPPPPMVPLVMAAGTAQYPVKNFLFEFSLGRAIRYIILVFLAARDGRHAPSFFQRFAHEGQIAMVGMFTIGVAGVFFVILKKLGKPETTK